MDQGSFAWSPCFALLQRQGFAPRRVFDVGANRGNWTRAASEFFPEADYLLVEPQGHLEDSVQDLVAAGRRIRWVTAGVSDTSGQLPLTIAPDDVSSNFGMTAEAATAHGYTQASVEICTLDELVAEVGGVPDMVKIDVEGFELKALAGASQLLGRTEVIFIEAAVCATGIENSMAAVIGRMAEAGYQMIDLTDLNRSPKHGVLWLCELVFLRRGSALLAKVSSYQ